MAKYYVNKKEQPNGDHEVHEENCEYLPSEENQKYLGEFTDCEDAVNAAEKHYKQVNGCIHCSKKCHTT